MAALVTLAAAAPGLASARMADARSAAFGQAPMITMQPEDQTVTAGEHATFEASATGYVAVQWWVSTNRGATFANDTTDPGNKTETLKVEHVLPTQNGWEYRALFTFEDGTEKWTEAARLTVNVPPVVAIQPLAQTVTAGQGARFTAAASGRPAPLVHWQVSANGGHTFTDDRTDAGNSTGTLTIGPTSLAQNGYQYRAVFTNTAGTATSAAATLTVVSPAAASTLRAPLAAFAWFPPTPHTGEPVSLASSSTDATSPIIGFGWDLAGSGPFVTGAAVLTTSFATPGPHLVRLRVTDANGLSSVAAQTIPVTSPPPRVMQPFPIVRIVGSNTSRGTRLLLLSVLAPIGSRVAVSCHGRGCPARRVTRVARPPRNRHHGSAVAVGFPRFEHVLLRPGVVLEIRVSRPGEIGKYTRFAIRHGRLPARADDCLDPATAKPITCPL